MATFEVKGGTPLEGEIRPQGAKNEALQVLCATLLTPEKVIIHNIPAIVDVLQLIELFEKMGVIVHRLGEGSYSFEAKEIDFDTVEEQDYLNEGTSAGRGFAVSGGVAKAVTDLVHEQYPDMEIQTARAEGLRECRKLMMLAKAGKFKGCLLEGMACPGGCVAGAGTILPVDKAAKLVEKYSREAAAASPVESAYSDRGESLE